MAIERADAIVPWQVTEIQRSLPFRQALAFLDQRPEQRAVILVVAPIPQGFTPETPWRAMPATVKASARNEPLSPNVLVIREEDHGLKILTNIDLAETESLDLITATTAMNEYTGRPGTRLRALIEQGRVIPGGFRKGAISWDGHHFYLLIAIDPSEIHVIGGANLVWSEHRPILELFEEVFALAKTGGAH